MAEGYVSSCHSKSSPRPAHFLASGIESISGTCPVLIKKSLVGSGTGLSSAPHELLNDFHAVVSPFVPNLMRPKLRSQMHIDLASTASCIASSTCHALFFPAPTHPTGARNYDCLRHCLTSLCEVKVTRHTAHCHSCKSHVPTLLHRIAASRYSDISHGASIPHKSKFRVDVSRSECPTVRLDV